MRLMTGHIRSTNRAKNLFGFYLLILLIINVYPFSGQTDVILHGYQLVFRLDYLLHAVMVLGFAWIYVWSKLQCEHIFREKEALIIIAISLLAALLLEGIQYYLPYRKFNPMDMLSNGFGAIIGSMFILFSDRLSKVK